MNFTYNRILAQHCNNKEKKIIIFGNFFMLNTNLISEMFYYVIILKKLRLKLHKKELYFNIIYSIIITICNVKTTTGV